MHVAPAAALSLGSKKKGIRAMARWVHRIGKASNQRWPQAAGCHPAAAPAPGSVQRCAAEQRRRLAGAAPACWPGRQSVPAWQAGHGPGWGSPWVSASTRLPTEADGGNDKVSKERQRRWTTPPQNLQHLDSRPRGQQAASMCPCMVKCRGRQPYALRDAAVWGAAARSSSTAARCPRRAAQCSGV